MKRIILALVVLSMVALSSADTFAVSESACLFLMISPGARASGMGEAFVALADDATAVYWNPAGLTFQSGREITIMHANWLPQFGFKDLYYDFLAYRQSVEALGTIGGNVTFLSLGKQYITGENSPDILGEFSSYELAVTVSYGAMITENLGMGVNLRYIRSNLSEVGAGAEKGSGVGNAFAVDIGTLYKAPWFRGLSLGANLSNMGPKITYIDASQADPLPTNLRLGFAYKLLDGKYNKITICGDVNKLLVVRHKDGSSDPFYQALFTSWVDDTWNEEFKKLISSVGVEYWYSNLIALRAGYYYDETGKVKYATFGAGVQYSLYRFDFGYVSAKEGHPLSDTMRFSLTIGF